MNFNFYSRQHHSLTSLIHRVVYCQFCKARHAHTKRESLETMILVTFDPGTSVHKANIIARNKGDYSWMLPSEERIKEASR